MENNNAPFYVGQKVVALRDFDGTSVHKDDIVEIESIEWCCNEIGFRVGLKGIVPNYLDIRRCRFCHKRVPIIRLFKARDFAPLQPLYSDITKELADKAMEQPVEVDGPVKKEVVV